MDRLNDYSDSRFKGYCIHCGMPLSPENMTSDHVPTKSLLQPPYPKELPVVPTCRQCNSGFSRDEEYFAAFLGAVLDGSTEPDSNDFPIAAKILNRNRGLRQSIEESRRREHVDGRDILIWQPEIERVHNVITKNALGHYFYEYGQVPLEGLASIEVTPLSNLTSERYSAFDNVSGDLYVLAGWPEVGSRMMQRVWTGQDLVNGWVVVQDGIYRYAIRDEGVRVSVRIIIREYLRAEVVWEQRGIPSAAGLRG